eukprot:m.82704 g.82704  ORF g.82704 m.82704 type:complete len:384 (-) comp14630_c0_seq1:993-2144(-)
MPRIIVGIGSDAIVSSSGLRLLQSFVVPIYQHWSTTTGSQLQAVALACSSCDDKAAITVSTILSKEEDLLQRITRDASAGAGVLLFSHMTRLFEQATALASAIDEPVYVIILSAGLLQGKDGLEPNFEHVAAWTASLGQLASAAASLVLLAPQRQKMFTEQCEQALGVKRSDLFAHRPHVLNSNDLLLCKGLNIDTILAAAPTPSQAPGITQAPASVPVQAPSQKPSNTAPPIVHRKGHTWNGVFQLAEGHSFQFQAQLQMDSGFPLPSAFTAWKSVPTNFQARLDANRTNVLKRYAVVITLTPTGADALIPRVRKLIQTSVLLAQDSSRKFILELGLHSPSRHSPGLPTQQMLTGIIMPIQLNTLVQKLREQRLKQSTSAPT